MAGRGDPYGARTGVASSLTEAPGSPANEAGITVSQATSRVLERERGIEPLSLVWKTRALPLSYTREVHSGAAPVIRFCRPAPLFLAHALWRPRQGSNLQPFD